MSNTITKSEIKGFAAPVAWADEIGDIQSGMLEEGGATDLIIPKMDVVPGVSDTDKEYGEHAPGDRRTNT